MVVIEASAQEPAVITEVPQRVVAAATWPMLRPAAS